MYVSKYVNKYLNIFLYAYMFHKFVSSHTVTSSPLKNFGANFLGNTLLQNAATSGQSRRACRHVSSNTPHRLQETIEIWLYLLSALVNKAPSAAFPRRFIILSGPTHLDNLQNNLPYLLFSHTTSSNPLICSLYIYKIAIFYFISI